MAVRPYAQQNAKKIDACISSKNNYSTRLESKSTYYIDQVRTNYGKFNLHFSGPSVWNNLDEEIKTLSLRLFKQTLTKQFLSSYASC